MRVTAKMKGEGDRKHIRNDRWHPALARARLRPRNLLRTKLAVSRFISSVCTENSRFFVTTTKKKEKKRERSTEKGKIKKTGPDVICARVCVTRVKRSSFSGSSTQRAPISTDRIILSPSSTGFCIDMCLNFSRSSRGIYFWNEESLSLFVDEILPPSSSLPAHREDVNIRVFRTAGRNYAKNNAPKERSIACEGQFRQDFLRGPARFENKIRRRMCTKEL